MAYVVVGLSWRGIIKNELIPPPYKTRTFCRNLILQHACPFIFSAIFLSTSSHLALFYFYFIFFFFTTTLHVFLAAKLWKAALPLFVSSLPSPSWTDERGRDGRGRLATHRACVFLRTCYTQARVNRTRMFVDSGTRLRNWFLIGYSRIDTFSWNI